MLSTTSSTLSFYQSIIASPELLANGYTLIKQYLFASQQNRSQTLINISHPQLPILSLIVNIYPNQIFNSPHIQQHEKQQTRAFLVNLLTNQFLRTPQLNSKFIGLLLSFIHKIHNIQGFEGWVLLYQRALDILVENRSDKFGFFILSILKQADDRVNEISRHILGLIVGSDWVPNPEEQLEIIYYCYKSMAALNGTDPETIEKYVSDYIKPTIGYIIQNMKKSVRAMKFSLKTLTILLADYQQSCQGQLLKEIETTTQSLIVQYINHLNQGCNASINSDLELQEQQNDSDPIQIVLYQMLELFMTLYGNKAKLNHELAVYLCLVSTLLSQQEYTRYVAKSDQYLMEIEDEGEANIRNKSIYFLQEMLQSDKYGKKCKKMLMQFINQILNNLNSVPIKVGQFLSTYSLPAALLNVHQIYIESALFVLYSFTDDIIQNEKDICMVLGYEVQNSPANSIDSILSVTILNKLIKNQTKTAQHDYLVFLRTMTQNYSDNIGMLIALMRGYYTYSNEDELLISQDCSSVPFLLLGNLLSYLYRNDSAQLESGYLIIEFLIHLLKRPENKILLQQVITSQNQLYLLKTYINDGITSSLIIDLIASLANHQTINIIYRQILNGYVVDQSLPSLIAKSIANRTIVLSEDQIAELFLIYAKKLDIISEIIVAFLEANTIQSQKLISLLNTHLTFRWIPHLIKQNLLFNLKDTLLNCVKNIVANVTSPSELENQLVLPYSVILQNPRETAALLSEEQLLTPFFSKLFDYAKLFKGTHLKIVTLHIFCEVAFLDRQWLPKVAELYEIFGKIESDEWQDENDDEQERVLNKFFSGIVNEQVEKVFKFTFGELAWESSLVEAKVAQLRQMM